MRRSFSTSMYLEPVVVQVSVTPRVHDAPVLAGLVVLVVKRQAVAIGMAHHVVLVVGEAVGMAKRIYHGDQVSGAVVLVADEGMVQIRSWQGEGHFPDAALFDLDADAAASRLVDAGQLAAAPFEVERVTPRVGDSGNRVLEAAPLIHARELLREVIRPVLFRTNLVILSLVRQQRPVHHLELARLVPDGDRDSAEKQRPGGRVSHRDDAVKGIDLEAGVRGSLPALTT